MTFKRKLPPNAPVQERIRHFDEFARSLPPEQTREQGHRCMNCGVPFCHYGCPLGNLIPDFNDQLKDDNWRRALDVLHSTNNFPEFTGRVCPALCEAACVLGINEPPVTIEYIEREISEHGWREGWITPEPPTERTGKSVAVVGSGPSGLAAAQQLNRAGHRVTVFERADTPGGLLAYGIPDFKLSKAVVARRIQQIIAEGVEFRCQSEVGKDISAEDLLRQYNAVLLTVGSTVARDLAIPGRDLDGVHFAMEFLAEQNRRMANRPLTASPISARDKRVVVLGGGDTGSDCLGTAIRQGAKHIWSFELLPRPPLERAEGNPWPYWPFILRTSTSHEEGGERDWSILTKEFVGENGRLTGLHTVRLEWGEPDRTGRRTMKEIPGSDFTIECDMVLLALGFLYPEHDTAVKELGTDLDARGNIKTDAMFQTSRARVFAAGDARRGQSLVVWAIHEGREAARCIDIALMGSSDLPSANTHAYDLTSTATR